MVNVMSSNSLKTPSWNIENIGNQNLPRMDLLDTMLIQEVNIKCLLSHVIKLTHLLQTSG